MSQLRRLVLSITDLGFPIHVYEQVDGNFAISYGVEVTYDLRPTIIHTIIASTVKHAMELEGYIAVRSHFMYPESDKPTTPDDCCHACRLPRHQHQVIDGDLCCPEEDE